MLGGSYYEKDFCFLRIATQCAGKREAGRTGHVTIAQQPALGNKVNSAFVLGSWPKTTQVGLHHL